MRQYGDLRSQTAPGVRYQVTFREIQILEYDKNKFSSTLCLETLCLDTSDRSLVEGLRSPRLSPLVPEPLEHTLQISPNLIMTHDLFFAINSAKKFRIVL